MIGYKDCQEKSDKELVEMSLLDGDNFVCLIKKYKDKLYSYIRRITDATHEDTEDILQEVFIKVYLNLNDFDKDLKFSSWIFRIAHNQVISNHRKNEKKPHYKALELDDSQVAGLMADCDIENKIDREILKIKIADTFSKMNSRYREIILLKFIEEKSYLEIADILEKPMGTIASLMNKAKKEF